MADESTGVSDLPLELIYEIALLTDDNSIILKRLGSVVIKYSGSKEYTKNSPTLRMNE